MRTIRFVTFVLVFVLAFSAWTPAPALASAEAAGAGGTRTALVSLTISNRTFGGLIVDLQGSAGSYSFYVTQGKSTYQIRPGKYTTTVSFAPTSLCKGWRTTRFGDYMVKTRKFTNLKNTLGPFRYCTLN